MSIHNIFYKSNFDFSQNIELNEQYHYTITLYTVGLNRYIATLCYDDGWLGDNCAYNGDILTIKLSNHKLPKGNLLGFIETYSQGRLVDKSPLETNIKLVDEYQSNCNCGEGKVYISAVDAQRDAKIQQLESKISDLERILQERDYYTKVEIDDMHTIYMGD